MNADTEAEPFNIILNTGPNGELLPRSGERTAYNINPNMVNPRLAARKFLAVFVSMDDPIAPNATANLF